MEKRISRVLVLLLVSVIATGYVSGKELNMEPSVIDSLKTKLENMRAQYDTLKQKLENVQLEPDTLEAKSEIIQIPCDTLEAKSEELLEPCDTIETRPKKIMAQSDTLGSESSTFLFGRNKLETKSKTVLAGIDVLEKTKFKQLKGKRVGLITNPTGVNDMLVSTIDILHDNPYVELVALFGPEHGVRGEAHAGDKVGKSIDPKTGLPIYSLYGNLKQPAKETLEGLDAIVYDLQDVGCRSYTYISTMGRAMAVAADHGLEFIVLDRPNPLSGNKVEGSIVEDEFMSFVSQFKIPYMYGLTCGELARLINYEGMLRDSVVCKLTVVEMEGWERDMMFDDTGLPWVMTSPHVPSIESAYGYPATGIIGELGAFSTGVGYTTPFQIIGGIDIDAETFATEMNNLKLKGVTFRPIYYKPFYGHGRGKTLGGVHIYFTDPKIARFTDVQFHAMEVIAELYPKRALFRNANEKRFEMFDKVMGSDYYRKEFGKNHKFSDIRKEWTKDEKSFKKLSSKYYLY